MHVLTQRDWEYYCRSCSIATLKYLLKVSPLWTLPYVLVFHVQVSLFGPRAEWQYLGHITETVMQSVLLQECEVSASAASGIGARNWTLVRMALAKPCILLLLLDSKTIVDSTELAHKSMCRIAGFWVQGFLPAVQPIQSWPSVCRTIPNAGGNVFISLIQSV